MRITYNVIARVNPCAIVPAMGEVIDSLNNSLKGFDREFPIVGLESTITLCEVSANRELTNEEQSKMIVFMMEEFAKSLPKWEVQIVEFQRQ